MTVPDISIITATYNASQVLAYAIRSVLQNDFQNWELIVVGDACTDDTEQVVASFNDPRIRFTNLAENSGQQATPNNYGMALARGRYVAFLNHDDMYLPFHLGTMLEKAQKHPGAILLAHYADIRVADEVNAAQERQRGTPPMAALRLQSAGPTRDQPGYQPRRWYIASSWFLPTAVARQAGPWRLENETYVTPSQDWLFRAWRQGVPVVGCTSLSVLVVCTGGRRGFFSAHKDAVHAYLYERYIATDAAYEELCSALVIPPRFAKGAPLWRNCIRILQMCLLDPLLIGMNIHPAVPGMWLRFGGRGGFIRKWRKGVDLDQD